MSVAGDRLSPEMRVLVACEFSGRVREAFARRGHDAVSCDLLPTDAPTSERSRHHQGSVLDILHDGWDLMVAHPPCTFLSNSGVRHLRTEHGRFRKMLDAVDFFNLLLQAPIPKICIENPIQHGEAKARIKGRYEQIVQPWMFGHPEQKSTCLWLKNLPRLTPTKDVREEMLTLPLRERTRIHYAAPGKDRWKIRSTTYQGLASAMASQWG